MKKILVLILLNAIVAFNSFAQRDMEVIADNLMYYPNPLEYEALTVNNSVIVQTARRFYKVTDRSFTSYPYPDGALYNPRHQMAAYGSAAYIVLWLSGRLTLFSFDGTNFHAIPIPGEVKSSPVLYQGHLYILSEFLGLVILYRHDGTSVEPVATLFLHSFTSYDLRVSGNHLYISGYTPPRGSMGGSSIMKRFDGADVFTFPSFPFYSGISQIEEIVSTGAVYFISDYGTQPDGRRHILYFDGSSVSDVYEGGVRSPISGVQWRSNFYFLDPGLPGAPFRIVPLRRTDGSTILEIPLPAGSYMYGTADLVVFNDAIHMSVSATPPGEYRVLSYDGSTFTIVFNLIGGSSPHGPLFLRGRKLLIQPTITGGTVYEFDGTSTITINAPTGYSNPIYVGITPCNFIWILKHEQYGSLLKEPVCPSIVLGPAIPRYFERFSLFTSYYSAGTRSKTWSNISAGWSVNDDCKEPDCSTPSFLISLTDAKNEIVWQQKFDKSFIAQIPVDDNLPLKSTFSSTESSLRDLIIMDQNLVEKGIRTIGLSITPKNESFSLGATTSNAKPVPLRVTLFSKEGKSVWEKEFVAPFVTTIRDKVAEPGEMFRFSIPITNPDNQPETILFNFTNPSHGVLNIEIRDRKLIDEGEVTVFTILGERLMSKRISNASQFQLQLPPHQSGLFVINIKTKRGSVTNNMIRLK